MLGYVTLAGAVALDPTHDDELGVARNVVGAVLNPDPRRHKGVTATYTPAVG